MREIIKLGLILFLVCLGASLSLGLTYVFTQGRVEAREAANIEEGLKEVWPEPEVKFEKKSYENFIYYEVYNKRKDLRGYIAIAEGKGYSGPIKAMAGVNSSGVIKGIKILEQQETPGLGSRIMESNFLNQFLGQTGPKIELAKEKGRDKIAAISGATISSQGVTDSVKSVVEKLFLVLKEEKAP